MVAKTSRTKELDQTLDEGLGTKTAPKIAARLTVNLSRKSADALREVAEMTEDSRTEVINKALQVYRDIRACQEHGGGVWLQKDEASEPVLTRYY
ncbi:hypothetical protein [Nocardia mangyaensis]|uniref:hypothetical protein n=1 Tax=Nocardia mangyaensis TaxID=2213200 RepID=UPI002674A46A|nr:hypothetical protein [Nocardia mangyaensis]MDO3651158.1 hypothetical protein [Nocardia mangyaensis]